MTFTNEQIENVIACELPAGVTDSGQGDNLHSSLLIKFSSGRTDRLHQVYLNGRYAGTTVEPDQRQMIVPMPPARAFVTVTVCAVNFADAFTDFSNLIPPTRSGRVRIQILRSQSIPLGSFLNLYFDNASGDIDYNNPLNPEPIPVWPDRCLKTGFGLGKFAKDDFGYDGDAAIGFGKGLFAQGPFGFDADAVSWTSPPLLTGQYRFAVGVRDINAAITYSDERSIYVNSPAVPAKKLSVHSYDPQTKQITFTIDHYKE